MKLFPDVSVQIPYDFVHFWDLSRSAVWNRSFRAIQVHKIKPKVTRQHFFFFAKRDFKIWKRPKYVTFFSIFLPIGSSLGCPTGYTQIGTSSCCRAGPDILNHVINNVQDKSVKMILIFIGKMLIQVQILSLVAKNLQVCLTLKHWTN